MTFKKIGLMVPPWQLQHDPTSIGCLKHHPPLEFLYAMALLAENDTSSVNLVDAHLLKLSPQAAAQEVAKTLPDCVVITTANGYGGWRTSPLNLTMVVRCIEALRIFLPNVPLLICGPHGSTCPDEVQQILQCDGVIRGEPEEVIAELDVHWKESPYIYQPGKHPWNVEKAVVNLEDLPAIDYDLYPWQSIQHTHGPSLYNKSVDVEWSRGCVYNCSFCNRTDFRQQYRERSIDTMMVELMSLRRLGIEYVHFVDDLFGLGKTPELLMEMRHRPIPTFGIQTRVDLWDEKGIDFLAAAGCRQIEFGLESPLEEVQKTLRREERYPLKRIEEVLRHAVAKIKSVHVSLLNPEDVSDEKQLEVRQWREKMIQEGCFISEPAKILPYPGTLYFKQQVAPSPLESNGSMDKAMKFYALDASLLIPV